MIFKNFPCKNNGKFMKFSRRCKVSLVNPEMSLVKIKNVPGKCLEGVATLSLAYSALALLRATLCDVAH